MKILSYIATERKIEKILKQDRLNLSDEARSKVIKYSGRLDIWITFLINLFNQNPEISENQVSNYLSIKNCFQNLLNQIPDSQHVFLLNPFLAPETSWIKKNKIIGDNKLFSFLFDSWLKKQSILNNILKPDNNLTNTQEKIIRALFVRINQTVDRDTLTQALYGPSWLEKYSDWMIDTIIYQLRKKLNLPYQIKTVKNRGYILHNKKSQNIPLISTEKTTLLKKTSGIVPSKKYLEYMNNPNSQRKVLSDLFKTMKREKLEYFFEKLFKSKDLLNILVINSFSCDNVDAIIKWLYKRKNQDNILFTNFNEQASELHRSRANLLGFNNIKVLYDDIRNTRLNKQTFDIIINDFRLNFNSSHQQNIASMKNIHQIIKKSGIMIISVVVDARYESQKYGVDQEKAPINKSSPWTFIYTEGLKRYCFPVPYYKKLFQKTGFKIIKEFDIHEGKNWFNKNNAIPNHEPVYRRFLLFP